MMLRTSTLYGELGFPDQSGTIIVGGDAPFLDLFKTFTCTYLSGESGIRDPLEIPIEDSQHMRMQYYIQAY